MKRSSMWETAYANAFSALATSPIRVPYPDIAEQAAGIANNAVRYAEELEVATDENIHHPFTRPAWEGEP